MDPKHPKKEVNDALDYANQEGFEVEQPRLATSGAGSSARAELSSRSGRRPRALTITVASCADGYTNTTMMPIRKG